MHQNKQTIIACFALLIQLFLNTALAVENDANNVASGILEAVDCSSSTDGHCTGQQSELFAIAHDHIDTSKVLMRLSIDSWSLESQWGDGTNGFFYWVTSGSDSWDYTPFNGVSVGTDGLPQLPGFSFIIPMSATATEIQVTACASEFKGSGNTPTCTTPLWTENYTTPPMPVVGQPVLAPQVGQLTFSTSTPVVETNGSYASAVELEVNISNATQEQLDWLFDHLVWFDPAGNAQTNSIYPTGDASNPQGVGVLSLEQATYLEPKSQQRKTKYGAGSGHDAPVSPNQLLFVYTQQSKGSQPVLGLGLLYDESSTCLGKVFSKSCGGTGTMLGKLSPSLTLTVQNNRATSQQVLDFDGSGGAIVPAAGANEQRRGKVVLTSTTGHCESLANPLAINATEGDGAYNPPNYVLDDVAFFGGGGTTGSFPRGLYYVVPTGFGNCQATARPFCNRTTGYVGYVPHYLDPSGESSANLNGGSTTESTIGGFALADQYELPDLITAQANSLSLFDSCGYWHEYSEPISSTQRLTVPPSALPSSRDTYNYTVKNQTGQPVVLAKECCGSFYQTNQNTKAQEPPQMLDDASGGFGMLIGGDAEVKYQTISKDEVWVVYEAGTGEQLFKVFVAAENQGSARVFGCASGTQGSMETSVNISTTDTTDFTVTLGAKGIACAELAATCPLGMTGSSSGATQTCTISKSSFLLAMPEWTRALGEQGVPSVQVRAWGAKGASEGGSGGAGGYALTVQEPGDLATVPGMFAYVAKSEKGGASLLGAKALSSLSADGKGFEQDAPSVLDIVVIGGGGGGGGDSNSCNDGKAGAAGNIAIANTTTVPGVAVSKPGSGGTAGPGGPGGGWDDTGSMVPMTGWKAGQGQSGSEGEPFGCSKATGGTGGAGWHGGKGGSTNDGGGAGGSWAAGNTVHDPSAPSGKLNSPGGKGGALQLVYVKGPCSVDNSADRAIVRCVYTESLVGSEALNLANLITGLFGVQDNIDQMPVYVEAWGGAGGHGGAARPKTANHEVGSGGDGGSAGYARSSQLWGTLREQGTELSIYMGVAGRQGNDCTSSGGACSGQGGNGGSATLTLTAPLSTDTENDPIQAGVVALAAGGGAGGGGYSTGDLGIGGNKGGNGKSAIATPSGDASIAGGRSIGGGTGGDSGIGGCGNNNGGCGENGVGGLGGAAGSEPLTPWQGLNSSWVAGAGGKSGPNYAGGGGAGYGGGGGGNGRCSTPFKDPAGCGGGAGGSWALQASVEDTSAPVIGADNLANLGVLKGAGAVALSFDICKVDVENQFCTGLASGFLIGHAKVGFERQKQRLVYLDLWGDENFDVEMVDLSRVRIGASMLSPEGRAKIRDRNQDGYPDLRFDLRRIALKEPGLGSSKKQAMCLEKPHLPFCPEDSAGGDPLVLTDLEAAICVHGALVDGTVFVGCAQPQTKHEQRAARSPQ